MYLPAIACISMKCFMTPYVAIRLVRFVTYTDQCQMLFRVLWLDSAIFRSRDDENKNF